MKTVKIFIWLVCLFLYVKADASVNSVQTLQKRNFDAAFQYDFEGAERETFKAKIGANDERIRRIFKLQKALHTKFFSETSAIYFKDIYEYEIINWPKYVPIFWDIWDERALDEIEAALPILRFKRKPINWRPKPDWNNSRNLAILNCDLIYEELLGRLNDQLGRKYTKIQWSDFLVEGWPEGVKFKKNRWTLENILSIYRNFEMISFVRNQQTNRKLKEDSASSRSFRLHCMINRKFTEDVKRPFDQIRMYKFNPWPACVSQVYKYWDEEAIDEIEAILPKLEFILKSPDWELDQKHFDIDRSKLRDELHASILQSINTQLMTSFKLIPWGSINITGWPEEIPQGRYFASQIEILKIYRALPKMKFTLKQPKASNESNNLKAKSIVEEVSYYYPLVMAYPTSKNCGDDFINSLNLNFEANNTSIDIEKVDEDILDFFFNYVDEEEK